MDITQQVRVIAGRIPPERTGGAVLSLLDSCEGVPRRIDVIFLG